MKCLEWKRETLKCFKWWNGKSDVKTTISQQQRNILGKSMGGLSKERETT